MPALTSILLGTGLAIAAAGSAYQAKSSVDAKNDSEAQAQQQTDQQNNLIQQQKDAQAKQLGDSQANAARDQAAARQRQETAASQGRGSTILTGALGTTGAAPTAAPGKTTLGT